MIKNGFWACIYLVAFSAILLTVNSSLAQRLELLKPYIALNPQGIILAVMEESSISILDAETGEELNQLTGFKDIYPPMTWSYSGSDLAFVNDGDIEVWEDVANFNGASKIITIKYYEFFDMNRAPLTTIHGINWSIDDSRLALGVGGTILLWDISNNIMLDHYISSEWTITSIATTFDWVDEDTFVIGGLRGSVHIVSLSEKADKSVFSVPVFTSYDPYVESLAVSHSGDRVVLAEGTGDGSTGRIYLWDFAASTEFYNRSDDIYNGHNGEPVYSMAWSPDDTMIASIGGDRKIQIWNPETGEMYQMIQFSEAIALYSFVWSADGSEILYVDKNGELYRETVSINKTEE